MPFLWNPREGKKERLAISEMGRERRGQGEGGKGFEAVCAENAEKV